MLMNRQVQVLLEQRGQIKESTEPLLSREHRIDGGNRLYVVLRRPFLVRLLKVLDGLVGVASVEVLDIRYLLHERVHWIVMREVAHLLLPFAFRIFVDG